jgi:phosphatidate cytidylyltransferase
MSHKQITINLLAGLVILLGAFMSIIGLHQSSQYGYHFILILLAIIWIADSAAYFTGKAFGKHKLAPHISPGKTWEGIYGAVIAIVIVAVIITRMLELPFQQSVLFIGIAIITMAISVVGDLMESLFKRRAGIKDSSQLLPGHGGILDRIDSLVAAAPVFLLGLILAGI